MAFPRARRKPMRRELFRQARAESLIETRPEQPRESLPSGPKRPETPTRTPETPTQTPTSRQQTPTPSSQPRLSSDGRPWLACVYEELLSIPHDWQSPCDSRVPCRSSPSPPRWIRPPSLAVSAEPRPSAYDGDHLDPSSAQALRRSPERARGARAERTTEGLPLRSVRLASHGGEPQDGDRANKPGTGGGRAGISSGDGAPRFFDAAARPVHSLQLSERPPATLCNRDRKVSRALRIRGECATGAATGAATGQLPKYAPQQPESGRQE